MSKASSVSHSQNPKKLFFVCQNIFLQKYPPFLTTLLNPEETAYNFLYVLNNKFSYTQLSFVFVLQKDSYFDYDDSDAFFFLFFRKILISIMMIVMLFFLFLQKDFDICLRSFSTFFFSFPSTERFWCLSCACFQSFSLFFFIKSIYHFYIYIQKLKKKI